MPSDIRSTYIASQAENTLDALEPRATFGHDENMKEITRLRAARDLTQVQLAQMSGCTQATISRIERGIFFPSHETLQAIADALGVHPGQLFTAADLQVRVMDAFSRVPPERRAMALELLEALANGQSSSGT
jgi:transcriptional regulator with XRE-family HTH domain